MKRFFLLLLSAAVALTAVAEKPVKRLKPLKGRIVVLTFDDATVGQREVVAPLLHKYGFGATFYVCEFPGFEDKTKYMSWDQLRELNEMGFEIGNHSRSHGQMSQMTRKQIGSETAYIEEKCALYGIPRPVTYAYPGYDNSPEGIAVLKERGYKLARHGGDKPYVKGVSDKMLMPSYGVVDARFETPEFLEKALDEARDGQVVIFCLHGVPDLAHDFVSTSPENFEKLLSMLKKRKCKVISMRDLLKYDL